MRSVASWSWSEQSSAAAFQITRQVVSVALDAATVTTVSGGYDMLAKRFLIIYGAAAALSLLGWSHSILGKLDDVHFTAPFAGALLMALAVPLIALLPLVPFALYRVITGRPGWRLLLQLPLWLSGALRIAWVGACAAAPLVFGALAFLLGAVVRHRGNAGDVGPTFGVRVQDASDYDMEDACDFVDVADDGSARPL